MSGSTTAARVVSIAVAVAMTVVAATVVLLAQAHPRRRVVPPDPSVVELSLPAAEIAASSEGVP